MWLLLSVSGLCVPLGWTSWSCRTVWSTAEWQRFDIYRIQIFILQNGYLVALVWLCILLFYSLGRCAPSPPAPTPSNKGRINTSLSWWTGRRTYCGALSWRGEQNHTHTHTVEVGWWYRFTSDCNGGCVFVTLQDLWLPCPLHRRVQHGSRCPAEAPGPVLERPCYQASVRTTERLLRLWIDATRHQQTDATNKWTPAFLLWYWLLVKSWTFYPLSQSLWPGSVNVSAAGK